MHFDRGRESREYELAVAHVRSSGALFAGHSHLRKMSALVHREDAVGIIVERIINSDSACHDSVRRILRAIWLTHPGPAMPTISEAIEFFGWSMVREVALVAMLHQFHVEMLRVSRINPADLDRQAIAISMVASHLGVETFQALFANVGTAGMAAVGGPAYKEIRRRPFTSTQDLSMAERVIFGFDHAALGAAMLAEADMPDAISCAALGHTGLGSPIWIAECLAASCGIAGGMPVAPGAFIQDQFNVFGFGTERYARIRKDLGGAIGLPDAFFPLVLDSVLAA